MSFGGKKKSAGCTCVSKISRGTISIIFTYIKCACVYVGLKVLHAACTILYTGFIQASLSKIQGLFKDF